MSVYHRYLGFFLAGIMAVYATSGIIMILQGSDFFEKRKAGGKETDNWAKC